MRAVLFALIAAAVLLGGSVAESWKTKDAGHWTREDAQQVLSHSPWTKEMPMPISGRGGVSYVDADPAVNASSPPAAELGNVPAGTSNGPRNARTPSLRSAPIGSPEVQPVLRIIWASALPVRLAAVRLKLQENEPATQEQVTRAEKDSPNYVIAVVGLPAPESASQTKALASGAFLSVHGKPAVVAFDSNYRRIGTADVYFFRFAKTTLPLTKADSEVEFKLTIGTMNIKQKFQPSAMNFEGRLAL